MTIIQDFIAQQKELLPKIQCQNPEKILESLSIVQNVKVLAGKEVDENSRQILIKELVNLYDTHSSHAQVKTGLKSKFEKLNNESQG